MSRDEHRSAISTWEGGACIDCGLLFPRRNHYEQRCALCYKVDKGYNVLWGDLAFLWAQEEMAELRLQLRDARRELKNAQAAKPPPAPAEAAPAGLKGGLLRNAIILCHPDKHGDSEAATKVTQQLLRLRAEERAKAKPKAAPKRKRKPTTRRKS